MIESRVTFVYDQPTLDSAKVRVLQSDAEIEKRLRADSSASVICMVYLFSQSTRLITCVLLCLQQH